MITIDQTLNDVQAELGVGYTPDKSKFSNVVQYSDLPMNVTYSAERVAELVREGEAKVKKPGRL